MTHFRSSSLLPRSPASRFVLTAAGVLVSVSAWAIVTDMTNVDNVHDPAAEHIDQAELNALPAGAKFAEAFEVGDELFATAFNALDGGGANVGRGQRYTRIPRADLRGSGEWFTHAPARVTGPNAGGCFECHEAPFEDGAGTAALNVHRDPFRTGNIGQFIERNTPHVFAPGAIQRLAEEMTDELGSDQQRLVSDVCRLGGTRSVTLDAKGIGFGTLSATRTTATPCAVSFNTDGVRGVDFQPSVDNPAAPVSIIVRPFQWKGSVAFLRDFNRGAAHNELGMQAVEVVGDNVDGDNDGVRDELSIGDMTALAVYMAAQPRPTTLLELNQLDLLDPPLTSTQVAQITRGRQVFGEVGCTSCHVQRLTLNNTIFSEPSQNAAFRDGTNFPAGQPTANVLDARNPVTFDLTRDQPDNIIRRADGSIRARLGSFTQRDSSGRTIVELYGDLRRHAMGSRLAEPVNEIAGDDVTPIPVSPRNRHTPDTFLTENLWGVGSTAPYMHDGRATTLAEAILEHAASNSDGASEARASRAAYLGRSLGDKQAVIAFLQNLVLFKIEEEDAAAAAGALSALQTLAGASPATTQRVVIKPKGFKVVLQ
jgi:di-heme oxidoreductase (putative peroxidase)